jgi:hypothetical protein
MNKKAILLEGLFKPLNKAGILREGFYKYTTDVVVQLYVCYQLLKLHLGIFHIYAPDIEVSANVFCSFEPEYLYTDSDFQKLSLAFELKHLIVIKTVQG